MESKTITVNGVTGTAKSLSKVFAVVPWETTYRRMQKHGWPVKDALLTSKRGRVSQKACPSCGSSLFNNAHTCPTCCAVTDAGIAADMRKYLK